MESKLIVNYLINPKRKTPSSYGYGFLNLSILLAVVIFLCPACDNAEQVSQVIVQPEESAVEQLPAGEGLAIGAVAPEFSLPDAKGNSYSLSNYTGQKLVLVFYRTGT